MGDPRRQAFEIVVLRSRRGVAMGYVAECASGPREARGNPQAELSGVESESRA
jgi:hypothetical protein